MGKKKKQNMCYLYVCEASTGRCSREVGIKVGYFVGVRMTLRPEDAEGQVQVWVNCPGTGGAGHVNTVWIDEITLA